MPSFEMISSRIKACIYIIISRKLFNYVDQFLPNFAPLPPSSGQKLTFNIQYPLLSRNPCGQDPTDKAWASLENPVGCIQHVIHFHKLCLDCPQDLVHTFSMALYHKCDVKNAFALCSNFSHLFVTV